MKRVLLWSCLIIGGGVGLVAGTVFLLIFADVITTPTPYKILGKQGRLLSVDVPAKSTQADMLKWGHEIKAAGHCQTAINFHIGAADADHFVAQYWCDREELEDMRIKDE